MRKLSVVLGVLALLGLFELGARGCSTWMMSSSVESRLDNSGKVTMQSGHPPFLLYGFGLGYFKEGSITVHDIGASPTSISRLSVSSPKLQFSRGALVSGSAEITGEAPYTVTVVLSAADIRRSVNAPAKFSRRYVQTSKDGATIHAIPEVQGEAIVLADKSNPSVSVTVEFPGVEYLPCKPKSVRVHDGLILSCKSETFPEALKKATS